MTHLKKLTVLLIAASPLFIKAQGYQVNLQGQAQQGMASAGTALIQDGAALFYNPGGASFLKGNTINAGMSPTLEKGTFLDKNTNQTADTKSPVSYPFAVYAAFELKDSSRLKLGFAIYTPFGSTVDWQSGWMGRFALTHLQLQAIFLQPTVSYKLTDKLGIGAGFVYSTGSVDLRKDIPVINASGNYGTAELKGAAAGYGFNAGVYYEATKKLSIGLSYRSQVNMKVNSGDATFSVPASLASSFPNGKFTSTLPLPQVLTLGLALKPTSKLALALDVNYVGWKTYDTLSFNYANNTSALQDTRSPRKYQNTFSFRLGGQYKITDKFVARLGVAFAMTPIKDGYVTPETPDANRVNYTAGLGYTFNKHFGLNASFLFTQLKRTDTNKETNLSGTYKTNVFAPGLAVFYNF